MTVHLDDAHEPLGGVGVMFRDVQKLARELAIADDASWEALSFDERLRYERLARSAVDGLGLEVVAQTRAVADPWPVDA